MFNIKYLLIIAILLIPNIHYAQYTDDINSNRPGESMSAYSVGKTVLQAEMGVYGISENHSLSNYDAQGFGADLVLRWGFYTENLEMVADLQYQYEQFTYPMNIVDKSALKQSVLGLKYLIYDPLKNYKRETNIYSWKANRAFDWHQMIPAVSLFAGANFTFQNNPYAFSPESSISPKVALITQNSFDNGRWVFVTNIIADYIGTDYPSYGYVLTLTRGFNPKWSAFVENQGFSSDFYSDSIVRGGAAYLINSDMQIDASIGTNFKDTPSMLFGGIGFSWRYDAKYEEVKSLTNEEAKAQKAAKKRNSRKK